MNSGPEVKLALIEQKVEQIEKRLDGCASRARVEQIEKREEDYVTKEQLYPIKSLVYGGTGLILTSVLTALVALVVKGAS